MTETGVLEHAGVRYCLIPDEPNDADGVYYDGGPRLRKPEIDGQGRLRNARGQSIELSQARPIRESDLWSDGDLIVAVKDWPVYAFSIKTFEMLPPELMDKLFALTRAKSGHGSAQFGVNWGGLKIEKTYKLGELPVGVGAWPARVLPAWGQYFVMLGPGNIDVANEKHPLFDQWEPVLYGLSGESSTGRAPREGETRLVSRQRGAFCRSSLPPRWLSFRARSQKAVHCGIMPILEGPNGQLQMPKPGDTRKSSFALRTHQASEKSLRTACVAIDFGTSNTAIAIGSTPQDIRKFVFTDATRAVNLTETVGLKPTTEAGMGLRFFPFDFALPSPVPTVLFEFDEAEPCFTGSGLFPRYAFPGKMLGAVDIDSYGRSQYIKQDFKWKEHGSGPACRRAYLEHLALLIGYELRSQSQSPTDITVVFTGPLAFSEVQTESLNHTFDHFTDILKTCGFDSVSKSTQAISESYANSLVSQR